MDEKHRDRRHNSLFWPMVFIGVGVMALLGNLGVLSRANFVVLLRLWPLALIMIGLDILFGRRWPAIGALIGLCTVALAIVLMLIGPSMGWGDGGEVKTDTFVEEIGAATSARVDLELSSAPTTVSALGDSEDLIEANLTYDGEINFDVRGEREKTVNLSQRSGWDFMQFNWFDDDKLHWDIALSPRLPLELEIDAGSGSSTLDLSRLQLTELKLNVGSGSVKADLPATENRYDALVDGGSGSCTLNLADGADLSLQANTGSGSVKIEIGDESNVSLRLNGGSGSITIDVPDDAAVRVDVRDSGSGSVHVPSNLERTRRGDDDQGTWETPGLAAADYQIEIIVDDLGSGSITVR